MSRPLRAWIEVELCRCCTAAQVVCPRCGSDWELSWPLPLRGFPARVADACDGPDGCGLQLRLEAVRWGPPLPAAEQPPQAAAPADLSDRQRLERLWQQPPAPRPAQLQALPSVPAPTAGSASAEQPRAPLAAAQLAAPVAPPAPPPPPPRPLPCPADADRYRLADWGRRGWLPEGVAPSAIAAAYRRRFGAEPRRDPHHRQSRAYSMRELGAALGALGLAPNPEPLRVIWDQALQLVGLPSTRQLLQQQARLSELREGPGGLLAVVRVPERWLGMVQGRAQLLTDALGRALGAPVLLQLQEVDQ